MIVVVGDGLICATGEVAADALRASGHAAGRVAAIASAASDGGAKVQVVAKVGEDAAGEAIVLGLGRRGIGHVALLRDPAGPTPVERIDQAQEIDDLGGDGDLATAVADPGEGREADAPVAPSGPGRPTLEPADVELALSYLSSFGVIVAATPLPDAALAVIAEAAAYAGAQLVVVTVAGSSQPAIEGATVLEAPLDDPDDRFAALVGRYAAGLDGGVDPATAFRSASEALGWEAAAPA